MPEDTSNKDENEPEDDGKQGETPDVPDRLPDDHPVVKALHKANEEAKDFRLKVKEYEDAELGDTERVTQQLDEARSEATKAQAEAMRLRVALDKGLNATQAKRLVGDTEEDLSADADELLTMFGAPSDREGGEDDEDEDDAGMARRPSENLKPGASNAPSGEEDPSEVADRVWRSSQGFV